MEGEYVQLYTFLTLAIDGGQQATSHPGRISDQEKTPVPIVLEARWISEQCGRLEKRTLLSLPYICI
jgi:hypothetical protein